MELLCCPEAAVALAWGRLEVVALVWGRLEVVALDGQLEDPEVQLVDAHLPVVEAGHLPLMSGDLGRLRRRPCSVYLNS